MSRHRDRRRSLSRLNLISEFKVICLRECPPPDDRASCSTPDWAVSFWREQIVKAAWYDPEKEALVVICLCTQRTVKGFNLVALGNLDTCMIHPREAFRPAIAISASAVLFMHNHPSGNPVPSAGDVRATRILVNAGQILQIEVLDHIVVGVPTKRNRKGYCSFKEMNLLPN